LRFPFALSFGHEKAGRSSEPGFPIHIPIVHERG